MLERNQGLVMELEKLEKGGYIGQIILHWTAGVVRILDIPKKPQRKEIRVVKISDKIGTTI